MKLWKYKNHDEYVKSQVDGIYKHPTVKDNVNYEWVQLKDIHFINDAIFAHYFSDYSPKFGICHGAKLGKENMWFEQVTGIDFIGTDLVIESNEQMKLINWDFHDSKKEWLGKFDVIYSNALDHSYDPNLALTRWIECLSDRGICILEHTRFHSESTSTDPFGATIEEYNNLIDSLPTRNRKQFSFRSKIDKTFICFMRG